MTECIHRILTRAPAEAVRRLEENGIKATAGPVDPVYHVAPVDFNGPRELDLDFLRPDILPPLTL